MAEHKKFIFEKTVYLRDTNAEGNVYFANYFLWQGEAREEFFRMAIPEHQRLMEAGLRIITVEAAIEYKHESHLFDVIQIEVVPYNVKRMTFELAFKFLNKQTGQLIADGRQRIAFADVKRNTLVPIPDEFYLQGHGYLQEVEQAKVKTWMAVKGLFNK